MAKKKNSKELSIFVFCVVIVFVILLIAYIYVTFNRANAGKGSKNTSVENYIEATTENIIKAEKDAKIVELSKMKERNRIEYYATSFIEHVENKEYQEAYELLNKDFRKNYFPSLKEFSDYCEIKFSKMMDVNYTNFERNGEIYVIWATITDAINGGKDAGIQYNIVVKENDYNDFELSFSVK